MAANEMERVKQLLPKISARLADKTERLVDKMKELQIFKDNMDIFQTLAESNNFEILVYLKETLRIEGHEKIVREIESKPAPTEDCTDNSSPSADDASDSFRIDLESKSDPSNHEFREMRLEMKKELQEMKNEIKEARAEAREHYEEAKKREDRLLELISKLEKEKDEMKKELEKIDPAGIDEAGSEKLQQKFQDLESNYNQLLIQMNKMGQTEIALRQRNQQLQKEIAQVKLALVGMQISKNAKGKMYTKLAAPTRQKTDKKC